MLRILVSLSLYRLLTCEHMKEFKFYNGAFLEAFRDVFMKVLHRGTGTNADVNICISARLDKSKYLIVAKVISKIICFDAN